MDKKGELKTLASELIANELELKTATLNVKELRNQQKEIKCQINTMMEDASIDQLKRGQAVIERKIQNRKQAMSKPFVQDTIKHYLSTDQLNEAMKTLYDERPTHSASTIKCTFTKKASKMEVDNDDAASVMSDSQNVANQFGL